MSRPHDLLRYVGFGVDEHGDVWMWSDAPTSPSWEVMIRQRSSGVTTIEYPRRRDDADLDTFDLVEPSPGHHTVEPVGWVTPLSAWRVDREHLISLQITLADGTCLEFP